MLLTDEQAIAHLREDSDADVTLYVSAATQAAMDFLNRRVYEDAAELAAAVEDGTAGEAPMIATDAIRAAILLTLGHLWRNREDVITGTIATEMPQGARALLWPYRVGVGV